MEVMLTKPDGEECENCRFCLNKLSIFVPFIPFSKPEEIIVWECHRYPSIQYVEKNNWCGEWKSRNEDY